MPEGAEQAKGAEQAEGAEGAEQAEGAECPTRRFWEARRDVARVAPTGSPDECVDGTLVASFGSHPY